MLEATSLLIAVSVRCVLTSRRRSFAARSVGTLDMFKLNIVFDCLPFSFKERDVAPW